MSKKDLKLALIRIWDLGSTKLRHLKKEKDFETIEKLFGKNEFEANEKVLKALYHKGLKKRHKDSSSLNQDVETALKKYKTKIWSKSKRGKKRK